ncbi:MAG TPA: hypothetical protein VMQ76_04270 [Terracidiphilus sp.]|nr:hypothetical protein [Terracidiphilus sp.]
MSAHKNHPYPTPQTQQVACTIQRQLVASIEDPEEGCIGRAAATRAWLELEQAKREWRGKPRLKPAEAPRLDKRRATATNAITEADQSKESLIPPPPVPAPPTPTPSQ